MKMRSPSAASGRKTLVLCVACGCLGAAAFAGTVGGNFPQPLPGTQALPQPAPLKRVPFYWVELSGNVTGAYVSELGAATLQWQDPPKPVAKPTPPPNPLLPQPPRPPNPPDTVSITHQLIVSLTPLKGGGYSVTGLFPNEELQGYVALGNNERQPVYRWVERSVRGPLIENKDFVIADDAGRELARFHLVTQDEHLKQEAAAKAAAEAAAAPEATPGPPPPAAG